MPNPFVPLAAVALAALGFAAGGCTSEAVAPDIAPFAELHRQASSLTLDADYVYVGSTASGPTTGYVDRIPKLGGAPLTLVTVPHVMATVAVDSENVYYADASGGPYSVPKSGGTAMLIGSDFETWGIVADADCVYYATWQDMAGYVASTTKDGVQRAVLASDPGLPLRIIMDLANVYWGNQAGEVWTAPKQGGGAPVRLAAGPKPADYLAQDDTHIYFTGGGLWGGAPGWVSRVAKQGGEAQTLVEIADFPPGIAVRAGVVYVGTNEGILTVGTDGAGRSVLEGTASVGNEIAADADAIYWISDSGGVYRLAR